MFEGDETMQHRSEGWSPLLNQLAKIQAFFLLLLLLLAAGWWFGSREEPVTLPLVDDVRDAFVADEETVTFAVIGDYGLAGRGATAVSNLVDGWQPDFIVTTGDNNYPNGAASTINRNVDQYYGAYVEDGRFFPSLGNHDWRTQAGQPYFDYFPIDQNPANDGSSGNERYYDFVQGPVHFFVLNSLPQEPDGVTETSKQAQWLQTELADSTTAWQVVVFHHAPYASGRHGNSEWMQWPFAEWGIDAVLTGHEHHYERLTVDDIPYIVNGLGGKGRRSFQEIHPNSEVRFNQDDGAMWVQASETQLLLTFFGTKRPLVPVDVVLLEKSDK